LTRNATASSLSLSVDPLSFPSVFNKALQPSISLIPNLLCGEDRQIVEFVNKKDGASSIKGPNSSRVNQAFKEEIGLSITLIVRTAGCVLAHSYPEFKTVPLNKEDMLS
ncbi:hypothetical protein ACTXT7_009673, partial [Hymenolepis weldensis]